MTVELSGTSQYYEGTTAAITSYPFTMAAHFNTDNIAGSGTILSISKGGSGNNYFRLFAFGAVSELWLQGNNADDGGVGNSVQVDSPNVADNTWYTAIATATGSTPSTDWQIYLDGNGKGTSTNNGATAFPTGVNRTQIGVGQNGANHFNGEIAECAIWNVELTAAERAMYDNFISPLLIRPSALVYYARCYRAPIDEISNITMTATGTPTFTGHRPIFYPKSNIVIPTPATSIPIYAYHYNHNTGCHL